MTVKLRCAIYTRKSSEEGLDQDFNSLHAQREACEAYVKSQVAEGWIALSTLYDDGGFSGGSMDRPGLQRLLADIAAGRVDVVVVYKVDRLTRSLADFAKIVEAFDQRGISFVSVTQAFNTTSSMGRLTLNVLLSFAQFEREVTGERIRDKIAASKTKGMWMGGPTPLGYDVAGRSLAVNDAEAALVRRIFDRYLEVSSVRELAEELVREGVRSKHWVSRSGRAIGGAQISLGALRHILDNRLYVGEIVHKGRAYAGRHPPIIAVETFEAVQAKLAQGATLKRERAIRARSGPLSGKIFDAAGRPMSPSFGYGRGGRVYRYYVTAPAPPDGSSTAASTTRLSAPLVEDFLQDVAARLAGRALSQDDFSRCVVRIEARATETHVIVDPGAMFPGQSPEISLAELRGRLQSGELAARAVGKDHLVHIVLPQRLRLRGGRSQLLGAAATARPRVDPKLVGALKRAHRGLAESGASPLSAAVDQHTAQAPQTQYERKLSRLAFLSPALQRRILSGRQPAALTLKVMLSDEMPLAWSDQVTWVEGITH